MDAMGGQRVREVVQVTWRDPMPYVAQANARKGETSYPFLEMSVGGKLMEVRGRSLYTVRSAIRRFSRAQKAKDSKFKRRYAARIARDERGEFVLVWRLA